MKKYKRNDDNIASKIHDEIVMVNIEQGNYFGLNSVGSDIWELLAEPASIDELCVSLLEEYEIDRASCEEEVQTFINQLLKQKLIHEVK